MNNLVGLKPVEFKYIPYYVGADTPHNRMRYAPLDAYFINGVKVNKRFYENVLAVFMNILILNDE